MAGQDSSLAMARRPFAGPVGTGAEVLVARFGRALMVAVAAVVGGGFCWERRDRTAHHARNKTNVGASQCSFVSRRQDGELCAGRERRGGASGGGTQTRGRGGGDRAPVYGTFWLSSLVLILGSSEAYYGGEYTEIKCIIYMEL